MTRPLLYTASGELAVIRRPAGFARALELEPVASSTEAVGGALLERTAVDWWNQDEDPPPGRRR